MMKLEIESLAFGGDGLARHPAGGPESGKVIFVRGGLPGEFVEAEITARGRDFDRAVAATVIRQAPDRTIPPCPLFGRCGGCQLQHLTYPGQLAAKAGWIESFLTRAGVDPGLVRPVAGSVEPWGYRFRARLLVDADGRLGFKMAATHRLIEVPGCPVMTGELREVAAGLSYLLRRHPPGRRLEVEAAALAGSSFAVFRPLSGQVAGAVVRRAFQQIRNETAGPKTAVHWGRPKPSEAEAPPGSLKLEAEGIRLSLFPGVFAQAQIGQNRRLVETVAALADPGPGQPVLDLMAGMGNLSLSLAAKGAEVTAVEADPLACANGRLNARLNGLDVEFVNQPAEKYLPIAPGGRFATVIVDPPRRGIKELVGSLLRLRPGRIVYVSCQPATLARDIGELAAGGYEVRAAVPIDLFPQTFHLETVTLLTPR